MTTNLAEDVPKPDALTGVPFARVMPRPASVAARGLITTPSLHAETPPPLSAVARARSAEPRAKEIVLPARDAPAKDAGTGKVDRGSPASEKASVERPPAPQKPAAEISHLAREKPAAEPRPPASTKLDAERPPTTAKAAIDPLRPALAKPAAERPPASQTPVAETRHPASQKPAPVARDATHSPSSVTPGKSDIIVEGTKLPHKERPVMVVRRSSGLVLWILPGVCLIGLATGIYIYRNSLRPSFSAEFWRELTAKMRGASPSFRVQETSKTSTPDVLPGEISRNETSPDSSKSDAHPASPIVPSTSQPGSAESATAPPAVPGPELAAPPIPPANSAIATADAASPPPKPPAAADENSESFVPPLLSADETFIADSSPLTDGTVSSKPDPSDPELAVAQTAVQSLISARTVESLLPVIFDGERLREGLVNYYASRPLRPLEGAVIEIQFSGRIPATDARAFIFSVVDSEHPRGFPVSAEATRTGYKIDWESYIQWRDEWLRGFIENRPTGPYTLFVVLRRSHYFNDDVANLDQKVCFKIASAIPGDAGANAFVEKKSAVGKSLADTYEWGKVYFPVLELEWTKDENQKSYIKINRVVRPTWRRNIGR
jgi:hypothetical protein